MELSNKAIVVTVFGVLYVLGYLGLIGLIL